MCWRDIRLGDADLLRRAMGKKDREKMAKERIRFVEGCNASMTSPKARRTPSSTLSRDLRNTASTKSHSAAYGWVSYQTSYAKAHFSVEFMAALLTHDASTTDRHRGGHRGMFPHGDQGITPDVNRSKSVLYARGIRRIDRHPFRAWPRSKTSDSAPCRR